MHVTTNKLPSSKANIFYPPSILEEELKNRVAVDWFGAFDCSHILGKVDFCAAVAATDLPLCDAESVLWAEAKRGADAPLDFALVQLILTIGKERTFDKHLPPKYLAAFNAARIAFIPYSEVVEIFYQNDFNWNVAPSDHETREFGDLYQRVIRILESATLEFDFAKDDAELRRFIKANLNTGRTGCQPVQITKNNFTHIYQRWRETVMPTILMPDWAVAKKNGIIDADFFLADIFSSDNAAVTDRLNVLLMNDHYRQSSGTNALGFQLFSEISFSDGQKAHRLFWNRYRRPPRKEYWNYIVNRRDLLVPQDVRERKGSFFTPQQWVSLSQDYLAAVLGDNWQDDHYVWDCCCGTGNLEVGLTNKYNVWVSTLDQQDVDVIHQRIKLGANLLDSHVFQFDFLNDSFDKLPQGLKEIIDDSERRKHLVIYINPPYAEAGTKKKIAGEGDPKTGVSFESKTYKRFSALLGAGARELFALFFMRIKHEIPDCVLGEFSKIKHLQAPNFKAFRQAFRGKLEKCFIVPADTFDNVKGQFPIGFFVWRLKNLAFATGRFGDLEIEREFKQAPKLQDSQSPNSESNSTDGVFMSTLADVYDRNGEFLGTKTIYASEMSRSVIDWLRQSYDKQGERIGYLRMNGTDVQNNRGIYLASSLSANDLHNHFYAAVTKNNVLSMSLYAAIRIVVEPTWLNDRDQFLYPTDGWKMDAEFQSDCLVFTLFHGQNRVSSRDGINHWIPFTEQEVGAKDCFASHFMSDWLAGHGTTHSVIALYQGELDFSGATGTDEATGKRDESHMSPLSQMSQQARAVLDAGRELWRYYHVQPNANPNASFYDIRLHFQGSTVDAKGKVRMNSESTDEKYTELIGNLRTAMKSLARRIEPKVYEYRFLKR